MAIDADCSNRFQDLVSINSNVSSDKEEADRCH